MKLRVKGSIVITFPIIVRFFDEDYEARHFGYGFNDYNAISTLDLNECTFNPPLDTVNDHASVHNSLPSAVDFAFGYPDLFPIEIWHVDLDKKVVTFLKEFETEDDLIAYKQDYKDA